MERTDRPITHAAVLLAAVVGVFATSSLVFHKEFGLGVAVAVLIDVSIVGTFLVSSLMALLGSCPHRASAA
jgi:RND superfamily putative drug exporter